MLCFRTNVKGNLKRCKQFEQHMQSNRLIKRLGCDAKSHPLTPTPHAVRLSQHCSNKFTTQLGNPDDVAPKNSTASPTSVNILADRTMTHHGSELVCTSHNGTSRSAVTVRNQNCPVRQHYLERLHAMRQWCYPLCLPYGVRRATTPLAPPLPL